jgi:hypothetical protein
MSIEARMRAFIKAGYRPQLKSHLLPGPPDERYETLHWREWFRAKDGTVNYLSEPHADSVGWQLDAWPVDPDGQRILGGVFPTIEEALSYAESELAKYA